MSSFFSKQNVRKLQPVVQERADLLVRRFEEVARAGGIINLEQAFAAFTNGKLVPLKYQILML